MAYTFRYRAKESSTTTGTGAYTLAGAVTGYQSLACVGDLQQNFFMAIAVDGSGLPTGGWECFIGTYSLFTTTLTRDTVLASSNSGAAVNWGAGTKHISVTQPAMMAGRFIQQQYLQEGGVITGATTLPITSLPPITAGVLAMTKAITPKHTNNVLRIDVTVFMSLSLVQWMSACLFQDSGPSAIAGGWQYHPVATAGVNVRFTHWMIAGTVAATTFTVRIGGHTGTITMNGQSGARWFGGTMASSLSIREYAINP